jgi:hydrogenase nickel incorporation protein HypA/HybF
MHEIGIVQSVLDLALQTAQTAAARQILSVRVRVGALTGVVPDALQFAFEALREGTIAAEAQLEVETVAATCWCGACQAEFEPADWRQDCPRCHQLSSELRHGLELELASVEID